MGEALSEYLGKETIDSMSNEILLHLLRIGRPDCKMRAHAIVCTWWRIVQLQQGTL